LSLQQKNSFSCSENKSGLKQAQCESNHFDSKVRQEEDKSDAEISNLVLHKEAT